jgi:hypothetical protein
MVPLNLLPANAAVFADVDSLLRIAFGTILAILARKFRQTRTLELTANGKRKKNKKTNL